jgi:hypothetical protein
LIIVTSISPSHSNSANQHITINSWKDFGPCYSLNNKVEIEKLLKENYTNIELIETDKTNEHFVGKTKVSVNAIIDFAKEKKSDLFLINSDIAINSLPEFKDDGVTIFSRHDYNENFNEKDIKLFDYGFDVFYIPYRFLTIFPPSIYALGVAWWDYWVPFHCMKHNVPIYYPHGKFIFHKRHHQQYKYEEWLHIGEYFKLDFRFDKNLTIQQIATISLMQINLKLKEYDC